MKQEGSDMSMGKEHQITYLISIQQQIHENIRFADSKAGWIVAIDTALIGIIYSTDFSGVASWCALGATLVLCVGVWFGVDVVLPRQEYRNDKSFTDQSRIVRWRTNESDYRKKYAELTYDELRDDFLMLILDRSKVNEEKYDRLMCSIRISSWGWICAVLLLGALKFSALLKSVFQ